MKVKRRLRMSSLDSGLRGWLRGWLQQLIHRVKVHLKNAAIEKKKQTVEIYPVLQKHHLAIKKAAPFHLAQMA